MGRDRGDAPSRTDRLLGRYGGPIVAVLGFVITRFFVAETVALSGTSIAIAATVVPLVVGLALSVAGVALTVGAFLPAYVADVTRGCLLGTAAMIVALILTVAGAGTAMIEDAIGTQLLVANVLLAGAVGGMINGHRKASLRTRQEAIMRGANRARFINRLLRHEVLNAATIVDGHAELLRNDTSNRDRSVDAIRRGARRIESTINGVGTIAEERESEAVSLSSTIETAVSAAESHREGRASPSNGAHGIDRSADPDDEGDGRVTGSGVSDDENDDIAVETDAIEGIAVDADDRLSIALERLIEHALDAREAERVRIEAAVERHTVAVTVVDDGEPLSDKQRDVLEHGTFPEYDDPSSGFALQAVNLLVGEYNGRIRVATGTETRVTVQLPRASADVAAATVGVPYPDLRRTVVVGLVAGIAMGSVYWIASGVLPVIGALYGVESVAVGWITHLFHSVVFALLFVAGVSTSYLRDRIDDPLSAGAAGMAWGTILWFGAAGIVMPLWLRGVGIPSTLPNLPEIGLVGHLVWGAVLGVGYVVIGGRFD